jgi:hypothetical protein
VAFRVFGEKVNEQKRLVLLIDLRVFESLGDGELVFGDEVLR